MPMRQRRTRALVLIALLAAGTGVLSYATHLLRRSELQTIDARYSIRGKQQVPSDIVLVPIDNATVQDFREHGRGQFPFPRRYDAQVIDRLRRAGAKTIAVDLEFTQETDAADDNALIEAIGRAHGKVVLAASEVEPGGRTDVLGGPSLLRELGARAAEVRLRKDTEVDTDGVVRRLGYSYNGLRSFPVVTAEVFTGRPIAPSLFERGSLPIDFVGGPESIH
jgi:adenylate cyclase